jgi:type I restriction enzyme M protein
MINAINEVIRKNAFSYLEEEHIRKISGVYESFSDIEGFASVITTDDAKSNGYSLNISLYVREVAETQTQDNRTIAECIDVWRESSFALRASFDELKAMLNETAGGTGE